MPSVSRVGEHLKRHGTVFRDPMFEALATLRAHKLRLSNFFLY
jgi:hypothetical protein